MKQIKPQYNCSLELAMELVGGKCSFFCGTC